jgi:hypothetical protein
MSLQLFGHPFSSCTMKALIALYENETPFDLRISDPDHPETIAELVRRVVASRWVSRPKTGAVLTLRGDAETTLSSITAYQTAGLNIIVSTSSRAASTRSQDQRPCSRNQ